MILLSGNVSPAQGGVERTLRHLGAELRDRGLEVRCLEVHSGTCPDGVGVVPVQVEWARGPAALLNRRRLRNAIEAALRRVEDRVDQVWARNSVVARVAAEVLPWASVVFIPPGVTRSIARWDRAWQRERSLGWLRSVVWRAWFEPGMIRDERKAVRGVDAVVVFSENMAQMLREEHGELLAGRLHVVPPGVDTERFVADAEAVGAFPPELPPPPRVVFLGRLEERKGPALLLRSAPELPSVSFVFVGKGPDESSLRTLARDLGVEDRTSFVGHVDDPERYLARCDVFAMPSVLEPFGHVMLEALASGLPVVGFLRSSGARVAVEDVVEDGATGVLVDETSPRRLAQGIRRALEMIASDPDVPARCRRSVREGHQWPAFVDRVLELGERGRSS